MTGYLRRMAADSANLKTPDRQERARSHLSGAAQRVVEGVGSTATASLALLLMLGWIVVGLATGFREPWLDILVGVSGAVTFVMVFFIEHTTGRQLRAISLKLDEMIRSQAEADDVVIAAERRPLHEQDRLEEQIVAEVRSAGTTHQAET
jgi:low affinity Fe/Cu permease